MILSIHFYRNHLRRIYWKYMYSLYKKSMADNQHHYLPCKKSHFFIQALWLQAVCLCSRRTRGLHAPLR